MSEIRNRPPTPAYRSGWDRIFGMDELGVQQERDDVERDQARAAETPPSNTRLSRYADYDDMDDYPALADTTDLYPYP